MNKIYKIFIILLSFFLFTNVALAEEIEISSNNAILYNLTDDIILYEKNSEEIVNIASLTKIMTTIVAIENIDNFDSKVIVTKDMLKNVTYDLSIAGFKVGDILSYDDLLYATIIKSGADATEILAYSVVESKERFIELMNIKAKELGMNNSSFSNVIGIEGINHYSTAKDLMLLLKYSLKNNKFKEIFTKSIYNLNDEIEFKGSLYKINNDEEFKMDYVKGAKTGYTSKAGLCLASYSINKNTEYILITIGADYKNKVQHFLDTKKIYEYYFKNYGYLNIFEKGDVIAKVKSKYGKEYIINSEQSNYLYLNKNITKDNLIYEYRGKRKLDTNVKKGDQIGKILVKNGDQIIFEKDVIMTENVKFELSSFINEYPETIILMFLTVIIIILIFRIVRIKK